MKNQIIENHNGFNWSYSEGIINFFGAKGRKRNKLWLINALGGNLWVEVSSDSMMPAIRKCVEQDIAANGDRIAQVHLGPRQAVVFFLEGKLTVDHLMKAIEPEGLGVICIPEVDIDNRTVTVCIIEEPTHTVATADSSGNIL